MAMSEEKEKALALANILACQCHEVGSCPADQAGFPCPFYKYPCDDITKEQWYSWARKKEDFI